MPLIPLFSAVIVNQPRTDLQCCKPEERSLDRRIIPDRLIEREHRDAQLIVLRHGTALEEFCGFRPDKRHILLDHPITCFWIFFRFADLRQKPVNIKIHTPYLFIL